MEERQTITLDGVTYALDSLSETAQGALKDVTVIDQEVAKYNTQIGIAQIARDALITKIIAEKDTFEVIEPEAKEETPEN